MRIRTKSEAVLRELTSDELAAPDPGATPDLAYPITPDDPLWQLADRDGSVFGTAHDAETAQAGLAYALEFARANGKEHFWREMFGDDAFATLSLGRSAVVPWRCPPRRWAAPLLGPRADPRSVGSLVKWLRSLVGHSPVMGKTDI